MTRTRETHLINCPPAAHFRRTWVPEAATEVALLSRSTQVVRIVYEGSVHHHIGGKRCRWRGPRATSGAPDLRRLDKTIRQDPIPYALFFARPGRARADPLLCCVIPYQQSLCALSNSLARPLQDPSSRSHATNQFRHLAALRLRARNGEPSWCLRELWRRR